MYIPPQVHTEKRIAQRDTTDGSPAEIPLYIARPMDEKKVERPVLLLLQEAFGVNDFIQEVCQRFAKKGYVVVSPDMYYRSGHWQTFNYGDFPATLKARELLSEKKIVGDIQAVLNFVASLDNVDVNRIGVLGYCMGGTISYLTGCYFSDRIKAAAVYYGGGLTQASPIYPVPLIEKTQQFKVPMIGFFGGEDKSIPISVVQQLEEALQSAKVQHEIYFYPSAHHGFFCNDRSHYNPEAAQDAWHRTLVFFNENLSPIPPVQ